MRLGWEIYCWRFNVKYQKERLQMNLGWTGSSMTWGKLVLRIQRTKVRNIQPRENNLVLGLECRDRDATTCCCILCRKQERGYNFKRVAASFRISDSRRIFHLILPLHRYPWFPHFKSNNFVHIRWASRISLTPRETIFENSLDWAPPPQWSSW